ncbi:MAG TPA: DPP IV N-terminal domain-containing protein [Terriglobales bacterium]|nr:DPP IV N-terminal domain-containing protein [Terriglobales bacterium]
MLKTSPALPSAEGQSSSHQFESRFGKKTTAWRWVIALSFLSVLSIPQAAAQGKLADYERARQFLPGNLRHSIYVADVTPHWIGKTNRFWYHKVSPKGSEFLVVDAEKNTIAPAFDHARLATSLSHATHREISATDLPFDTIDFGDDQKSLRFEFEGGQWECALENYECKSKPLDTDENLSPDKKWSAVVKGHNLFLKNLSTGTTVQLTRDGEPEWDYATPLPSLRVLTDQGTQDIKQRADVFWSPDSSKLITYRIDSRNAGRFTSLQFVPPGQMRPKAYSVVYPLPGEVLPQAEPIIFDIESGRRIDVKSPPIELPFQDGPGFEWSSDSKQIFYDYDERGFKTKEIRIVDPETGEQRVVLREHSDQYVDPGETFYRFDQNTGELIIASEREGWNHLYLYDKDGKLENQITQGPWVVREIAYVDEKERRLFFLAGGREKNKNEDPYLTHLYSVGFDGKNLTLLTPENANHSVSVSPDGNFFVDNYSRADLPGESALRRTKDGSEVRVLEKTDVSGLQSAGWRPPEPFQGKASDNTTDLYALIWKPSNFDPAKKYPVVEHVYTGPQDFFVPKTFGAMLRLQSMAELGFVVVMIDGRGTTGRSRAFHLFSYRNLGGAFEDHVAMIKQMAARFPWIDINRVGIYGTSAGGYGAAHAMLVFPDFYKVGVTISGDHDARLDKAWWNELYQGYPMQDDYAAQSNVTMADRLAGHLLIEHGDIDENVHPVETMRFVDALMSANKNFDMLLVPNMYHGESGPHAAYLVKRRWDYFVQYLLGASPPADFTIKEEDISSGAFRRH